MLCAQHRTNSTDPNLHRAVVPVKMQPRGTKHTTQDLHRGSPLAITIPFLAMRGQGGGRKMHAKGGEGRYWREKPGGLPGLGGGVQFPA